MRPDASSVYPIQVGHARGFGKFACTQTIKEAQCQLLHLATLLMKNNLNIVLNIRVCSSKKNSNNTDRL